VHLCVRALIDYSLEACQLLKSDLSSVDFVIDRFLMKLFNTTNMDIINNFRQYFDVELSSTDLIVSEGLRKSSPNVTIFFATFQSQFDSLYLSRSQVSILSVFCFSFMFICYQLW